MDLTSKFTDIYDRRKFGGAESRSGPGSGLAQTKKIRAEVPVLVRKLGVKSILDAPCGDWFWMQHMQLGVERYIGVDIVPALIEKNRRKFRREGVEFVCLDLTSEALPKADLIFCRDCLVHLSYDDAYRMLTNFKRSGARYLLTTTFVGPRLNQDLGVMFWRPLNLQQPPFRFPPPLAGINEGCTEPGNFGDKSLGLWTLDQISLTVSNAPAP